LTEQLYIAEVGLQLYIAEVGFFTQWMNPS